jgi:hypothetical protein
MLAYKYISCEAIEQELHVPLLTGMKKEVENV